MLSLFLKTVVFVRNFSKKSVEQFGAQYVVLALFGLLNFPISFLFWNTHLSHSYDNVYQRLMAALFFLPLIFHHLWPKFLREYLPLYWFAILLYSLPFLATYRLLMNNLAAEWHVIVVLSCFLLVLLVDSFMFIFLLITGSLLAILYFLYSGGNMLGFTSRGISLTFYVYGVIIIMGTFFSRSIERMHRQKLLGVQTTLGIIAHELHTPISAIRLGVNGIQKFLPGLLNDHCLAKKANLPVTKINKGQSEALRQLISSLEKETLYINLIIDMLRTSTKAENLADVPLEKCSMRDCINKALERYPFPAESILDQIEITGHSDFTFAGSPVLMEHIIFNLLKNALHYTDNCHDGMITLSLVKNGKTNILLFKDTGAGIPPKLMPRIFDEFFTKRKEGTGLGLTFCKTTMKRFGGTISCDSVLGEYTEFSLEFPAPAD